MQVYPDPSRSAVPEENSLSSRVPPDSVNITASAISARTQGKYLPLRKGHAPKVRVGKRADGTAYHFFQCWVNIPGEEKKGVRQRWLDWVIGSAK